MMAIGDAKTKRLRYAMRSDGHYHLRMSQPSFDLTDERILEALQTDGRRSFRDIAREIGVAEGTVRTRVRRLEAAGVLRFLAFVDPSQLGQRVLALVFARFEAQHQSRVVDAATAWPETTYVSSLLGRADVYLQVICADNDMLWGIVSRLGRCPACSRPRRCSRCRCTSSPTATWPPATPESEAPKLGRRTHALSGPEHARTAQIARSARLP